MSDQTPSHPPLANGLPHPRSGGLVLPCVALFVALLVVFPGFAWFGHRGHGAMGVWAAVVAAVVCWIGGSAALLLTGLSRATPTAVHAALLSIAIRTGLPLFAGIVLHQAGGELAHAGVFGMILGYYLWALLVETLLSARMIGATKHSVARA